MRISYYCEICQRHIRSGDHTACKRELRQKRHQSEDRRIAQGKITQERYANGDMVEVLAKAEKVE